MVEIALLASKMHELNDKKIIKVKNKYPVLNTRRKNVISWWNSLDYFGRIEVGSIALHYHKITPNYKWKCYTENTFDTLTIGQQRIVKFVFSKKEDNWFMFDLIGMLKI